MEEKRAASNSNVEGPRSKLLGSDNRSKDPSKLAGGSLHALQSQNILQKTKQTMHDLWVQLHGQVDQSSAAVEHLERSSNTLKKTFSSYGSIQAVLQNSSRLFRKIQRSVNLYKWIFYSCLILYLVVCGMIILKRTTPQFLWNMIQSIIMYPFGSGKIEYPIQMEDINPGVGLNIYDNIPRDL